MYKGPVVVSEHGPTGGSSGTLVWKSDPGRDLLQGDKVHISLTMSSVSVETTGCNPCLTYYSLLAYY